MNGLFRGALWLSLAGVWACSSDDSPTQGVGGLNPSTAGSGGASGTAGGGSAASGGTGGASAGLAGGPSAGGSGSEQGPTPVGPVDMTGSAGAGNGTGTGNGGGAAGDAGNPPSTAGSCPPGPFAANPLEGAAAPQAVCTGMNFTEGAVWFAERNTLFFSDFFLQNPQMGRILSFQPGGECQELIATAGTNGLAIAPDGNLLAARHSDQTLTIFNLETLAPTVLVADNNGLNFNSPNDIAVRSDGNLYFTDPNFLLGGRASEQPTRAYRRDPNGVLTVIDEGANVNGITLSPDETKLYVSRFGAPNNILVFDIDASGAVSPPETFIANTGSDGMAIDCAGNLYITQNGVQVFSPTGAPIGTINAPGAANIAFGGPDRRTLFITATTQLLTVELAVPGLPY